MNISNIGSIISSVAQRFANLAIPKNTPKNEIDSIRLFNYASLIVACVTLPDTINAIKLGYPALIISKTIGSMVYLITPYLWFIRHLLTKKLIVYGVLIANIFVSASTFGASTGFHFNYVSLLFGSMFVFDLEKKHELFITYFFPMAAFMLLEATDYSLFAVANLDAAYQKYLLFKNFVVVLISAQSFALIYRHLNRKQRLTIHNAITEQETLNKELQRTTELLSSITENIEEIFWVVENGKFVYISPAFVKIYEQPIDTFLEVKNFSDLLVIPEDSGRFLLALKSNKFTQDGFLDIEYRIKTQSGVTKWLHTRTFPVIKNDKLLRIVGMTEEISRQKQLEHDLIAARESAEKAANTKSEFLSTMSHEIRTPMNAVIGMSYLLLQGNPREDQMEFLKTLQFSANNLLSLINDILDFSKIEAGKIIIEQIDFSLQELLEGVYLASGLKAQEKNIELNLITDPALPKHVTGDPVRLTQILNNLISNAIKFTEEGSVNIEVKCIENREDCVLIFFKIKDTGVGVTPENLPHIFNSFTQESSTTTRRFGGTGLGLTITKRLLELQNSEISVESKPGKGSEFYFTLEFGKSAETPVDNFESAPISRQYGHGLKGAKVLLVEDNRVNRLVAERFLQKWEVLLDFAENGKIAVDCVRNNTYDLILMDLQMPEMDGYQATTAIRNLDSEHSKLVPIIALTAEALTEVREKVLNTGMNDFITKPFKPDNLFNTISKYLGNTK